MLQLGDDVTLYSVVFVLVLLGTRSPVWSAVLTASLYIFLAMFRFPQVPASRARQVLHGSKGGVSVVAHRGGGHDAPENTIAAIREVRRVGFSAVALWTYVLLKISLTILSLPSLTRLFFTRLVKMGQQVWNWTWSSQQIKSQYWCMMRLWTEPPTGQDHWVRWRSLNCRNWMQLLNTAWGQKQHKDVQQRVYMDCWPSLYVNNEIIRVICWSSSGPQNLFGLLPCFDMINLCNPRDFSREVVTRGFKNTALCTY